MIARAIQEELSQLVREYKVVTITGPRQSGKTTLARMQFPTYHYVNLEDPEAYLLASEDPKEFLRAHPCPVIIDEIQRLPSLLSAIQADCDEHREKGRYILTGSHQPALSAGISQSLSGRTAILELLPLSLAELSAAGMVMDRDDYLYKGFMPQLYDEKLDVTRYYRNYYKTYVERDARQLVNIRHFASFELFIKLLAGRVGQLVNLNALSNDVGVSSTTLKEWLSILEASYLVFRLAPYYENFGKRVIKSPKLYFTEVGLAAYLLGLENPPMVARDPLMGNLFENMVVVEALKARYNAGKEPNLYFFRDSNGLEVDLIHAAGRRLVPMEIKAARTFHPKLTTNLKRFQQLKPDADEGVLLYAGDSEQRIQQLNLMNFTRIGELVR